MERILLIAAAVLLPVALCEGNTKCEEGNISISEADEIIALINDKRKELGEGMVRNRAEPGSPFFPKAMNMPDTTWSCNMESVAIDRIKGCPRTPPDDKTGYVFHTDYDHGETIKGLLQQVLDPLDVPLKVLGDSVVYSNPTNNSYYKSFAELMYGFHPPMIACALNQCSNIKTIYCWINVAGVTDGNVVYKAETIATSAATTTTDTITTLPAQQHAPEEVEEHETTAITSRSHQSGGGATYCENGSMTEDEVNCQILPIINHKRFALANGMQMNGGIAAIVSGEVPTYLPPGKNMNKLTWSCDLERKASDALDGMASNCTAVYDMDDPNTGHGYAFSSDYSYYDFRDIGMSYIIRPLASRIDYQNFTSVNSEAVTYSSSSPEMDERPLKYYANLMRSTATKIGCAYKTCVDFGTLMYYFYCITDQPDIKPGDNVYEVGSGSCDCTNFCDPTGLCTVSRPAPACIEAIFPKPTTEDPDTICAHGDMTDELRILMMDMHNIRRAQLARGQLRDNGSMLPSASNMNRLVWSCALEKEAHDHLAKCPTEGYKEPNCLSPADNFYRGAITSDLSTFKEMTIRTIRIWWDVYQNYPNPGSSAVFTESLVGTPIESYTRMGWAQTREIGCSIAKCGDEYVLSCRYRPNGNIANNPMYNVGLVCSECYIFGAGSCGSGGLCG